MQQLLTLYTQWAGHAPAATEQIPGAGSNRQYYRFTAPDGTTAVGVIGTSAAENHAFISIARLWQKRQLPTPRVLAVSGDEMRYLQTDLGSRTLFDALKAGREAGGRYTLAEQELLKRVMRQLPNLQVRGAIGMDWSVCYPQPEMDIDTVLFDLNYFKYCFLKTTGVDFHEMKLEASFRRMAKDLTSEPSETFLYRDFQARNIMLDTDGNPSFIDFQGGRRGPYYYDVASFLWQASAHYSFHLRRELIATYYDALKQYIEVPSTRHFAARLSLFVLFRTLQVLGAYGFRAPPPRTPSTPPPPPRPPPTPSAPCRPCAPRCCPIPTCVRCSSASSTCRNTSLCPRSPRSAATATAPPHTPPHPHTPRTGRPHSLNTTARGRCT